MARTETVRFMVRLPQSVAAELAKAAQRSMRSKNAEAVMRIREYAEAPVSSTDQEVFLLRRFRQMSRAERTGLIALLRARDARPPEATTPLGRLLTG